MVVVARYRRALLVDQPFLVVDGGSKGSVVDELDDDVDDDDVVDVGVFADEPAGGPSGVLDCEPLPELPDVGCVVVPLPDPVPLEGELDGVVEVGVEETGVCTCAPCAPVVPGVVLVAPACCADPLEDGST